jgi:hypothetical protein
MGLFVDHRMRGESSIARQIALALPPNEEPAQPSKHTGQGGGSLAHGEQVETGGDSTKTDKVGSDKTDDSHAHTNASTSEGGKPAKHASAAPPESMNGAPPEKSPPPQPAVEMPKDPSAAPSLEKDKTTPTPTAAPKENPLSFADFRKLVEEAQHLPTQAIGVSRPDVGGEAAAPVPLITFEPAKSPPTDVQLHIIQQKGAGSNSPAQLLLHDLEIDGDRRSWECCLNSADTKRIGSFELSAKGLCFVSDEHHSSEILAQLAECCLLLRGVKPDECTYLQLSHPAHIPPLNLPLHHSEWTSRALLEANAEIAFPVSLNSFDQASGGHLSMRVMMKCGKGKLFTSPYFDPLALPIVIRAYLELPLEAGLVSAPCDLLLSRNGDAVSLTALVNAFGDQDLFDQLRKSLESENPQINFNQKFWPYARNELTALLLLRGKSRSADPQQGVNSLVRSIEKKLEPKPGAVPFENYIDSLRTDILSSVALTKTAESAVDARHPPSPPPPEAKEKDGAARPTPTAQSVEGSAAIAKEKEALLETWCIERLNEMERRCAMDGRNKLDAWPQADKYEYATLFLWHRIHRLEDVLSGLSKETQSPIAIQAEAHVELKLVWPQSLLPEGVSCQPETLLLQSKP